MRKIVYLAAVLLAAALNNSFADGSEKNDDIEEQKFKARPEVKNGTFYLNSSPKFLIGPWLDEMYGDGNTPIPIDGYKNDPAYNQCFDKEIALSKGFSTAHPPVPLFLNEAPFEKAGIKLKKYWPDSVTQKNYFPAFVKKLGNIPLVVDYALIMWLNNRDVTVTPDELYQINNSKGFIPLCPENPESKEVLRAYWKCGAENLLNNGANPWIYEIFNEPVYNCRCKYNLADFSSRMESRYINIETANKTWGTSFISFKEIASDSRFEKNRALFVDWLKFTEDRFCEILKEGISAIREVDKNRRILFCNQRCITQSLFGDKMGLDEYKTARIMDVVCTEGGISFNEDDSVQKNSGDNPFYDLYGGEMRIHLDCARAAAEGKPVIDNEQSTARYNASGKRIPSKRKDLNIMLWNELIHGASSVQIYAWGKRQYAWPSKDIDGAEKFVDGKKWAHTLLLNPYCYPGDSLEGINDFNKELKIFGETILPFPRIEGKVALLLSNPSRRFTGNIERPFTNYYNALTASHYPFDVIYEEQIIKGMAGKYQTVISPFAENIYPETLGKLKEYVSEGGTLILQGMDLTLDEYGKPIDSHDLTGLKSRTKRSLKSSFDLNIIRGTEFSSKPLKVKKIVDAVTSNASVWASDSKSNVPQIFLNCFGKGKVYITTCSVYGVNLAHLLEYILKDAGVRKPFEILDANGAHLPAIEAQVINRGDRRIYYLLNMTRMGNIVKIYPQDISDGEKFYIVEQSGKQLLTNKGVEQWSQADFVNGIKVFLSAENKSVLLLTKEKPPYIQAHLSGSDIDAIFNAAVKDDKKYAAQSAKQKLESENIRNEENGYAECAKEKCFQIDISKFCNMGFADEAPDDGKGGAFDQGHLNDFREFPAGEQTFSKVPFKIIDPAKNGGQSIIVMNGHGKNYFPGKIGPVTVERKCISLYFLHTTAWGNGKFAYKISYEDGSEQMIDIISGKGTGDWWNPGSQKILYAKVAWTGRNDDCSSIGVYCMKWNNPNKDKTIKSIDIISECGEMIPAVFAITGQAE